MTGPSFAPILDRPSGEIKRPPPLPVGTYLWAIKGLPRQDKSSKKQTEFVEFNCIPVAALDDVDQEQLQEIGGLAEKFSTLTFYLTEKSGHRLVEFLVDDLQIDPEPTEEHPKGSKPPRQMLDETSGRQFLGHVKHTPSEDGKGVYANIDQTAPVESN